LRVVVCFFDTVADDLMELNWDGWWVYGFSSWIILIPEMNLSRFVLVLVWD